MPPLRVHAVACDYCSVAAVGTHAVAFQPQSQRDRCAGRFDALMADFCAVCVSARFQCARLVRHAPRRVSYRCDALPAQRFAVQQQFNLLTIRINPHVDRLALAPLPVPVRQYVQHGRAQPVRLILIERVLAVKVQVDGARLRAQPRPERLAAVLYAGPLIPAAYPRPRHERLPRMFARQERLVGVVVIPADVSARVGQIPAARGARGAVFGGYEGLIRVFGVYRVDLVHVIVNADHVDVVQHCAVYRIVRHRRRYRARAVQFAYAAEHGARDAFSGLGKVERLFIACRPEYYRRVVAVAAYQHVQLRHCRWRAGIPARFSQYKKAQLVQHVHSVRVLRIVRAAIAVRAHLAQQLQPVALHALGHCLAGKTVILMAAYALYLDRAVVQEETFACVKAYRAEAEAHFAFIDDAAGAAERSRERVKVGRLGIPQRGGEDFLSQVKRVGPARGHAYIARHAGDFLPGHVARDAFNIYVGGRKAVVADFHINRHLPNAIRYAFRMHKHAVARQRGRVRYVQPYIAVYARALVPPALVLAGIDVHRDNVFRAEINHVGYVHLKRGIAALVGQHVAAVYIYAAMRGYALEVQPHARVIVKLRQCEVLAVPRVVVLEKAQRFVIVFVRALKYRVIVRQIHARPCLVTDKAAFAVVFVRVKIIARRRAAALAFCLGLNV